MFYKIREMECMFLFLCILRLIQGVVGDCTVDSPSENKYLELLVPLKEKSFEIVDANKEYKYKVSFCKPVQGESDEKFKDAGVMQYGNWENNTQHIHMIGKITDTDIKTGSNWILLTYKEGENYSSHCDHEPRQAHIMLLCNKDELMKNQQLLEENNDKETDCSYLFELESNVSCTAKAPGTSTGSKSLSLGSIICIIVLTVIVAYIFFGFLYNRFILGAKGIEQFPNVAFWRDFGNLEADGCDFVFRSRPAQEPRSYKGLGDDQLGIDEDEERDDHLLPM